MPVPVTPPPSPPSRCKSDSHSETTNQQTHAQPPMCFTIWQGPSTFKGAIKLGESTSLNQGNIFDGSPSGGIKQDGSVFEGEIYAEKSAKVSQGNRINGHIAEDGEIKSAES